MVFASIRGVALYLFLTCTVIRSFWQASSPVAYRKCGALFAKKVWTPPPPSTNTGDPTLLPIPEAEKEIPPGIAFTIDLPKKGAGISWGSDLSFRWIYVLALEPTGEAFQSGLIQKVGFSQQVSYSIVYYLSQSNCFNVYEIQGDYIIGFGNTSTIAKDFDFVLTVRTNALSVPEFDMKTLEWRQRLTFNSSLSDLE